MEIEKLANVLARIYFEKNSENYSASIAIETQRCYESDITVHG